MIIYQKHPVLLQIIYFLPDYPSLLQEFTWTYDDVIPELKRTHNFLNYWHRNIDAIIAEILVSTGDNYQRKWRGTDKLIQYQ